MGIGKENWATLKIPTLNFDRLESRYYCALIRENDMGQMDFFDIANRYTDLDAKNDPLVQIDALVPWKTFRGHMEAAWLKP